jgi:hypothetical protein
MVVSGDSRESDTTVSRFAGHVIKVKCSNLGCYASWLIAEYDPNEKGLSIKLTLNNEIIMQCVY